jgi:hypothetical protein
MSVDLQHLEARVAGNQIAQAVHGRQPSETDSDDDDAVHWLTGIFGAQLLSPHFGAKASDFARDERTASHDQGAGYGV